MKFQQEIVCLIFLPCFILLVVGSLELYFLYGEMKAIISDQSDSYYQNEIKQLQQVQKAIKLHLDLNHQNIYLQIQTITAMTLKLQDKKIITNPKYIPLAVSNLAIINQELPQKYVDLINQNYLYASSWYLKTFESEAELDQLSQQQIWEQGILDAIQRPFIYESNLQLNNSFHIVDIFRAYQSNGFFQKIPSSMTRNFLFPTNSTCNYTTEYYDPRCKPWYINSARKYSLYLDPPQQYNTSINSYYGTGFCAQVLNRDEGYQGSLCGRVNLQEFNNIIYSVNTRSSIFFTLHRDTREATLYFKNNKTFTTFYIGDPVKNPYYYLLPKNYELLITNLQQNYSSYNFASDKNLVTTSLADEYTAIISPITIIDKMYTTNSLSQLILDNQDPLTDSYRYFDVETPNVLNNAFFIFQVLSKSEVLDSYQSLNEFINRLYLTFMVTNIVLSLLMIYMIYSYSIKISHRLHSPIDKFLKLFQSIKPQDLLYIDIFQEGDSFSLNSSEETSFSQYSESILAKETDDAVENHLTSYDTIILYNSFHSMFQMVRYSNYEYYRVNYGKHNDKRAIGICCMNIGNIHFNCERFTEAMEAYQQGVIMANYELEMYKEEEIIAKQPNEQLQSIQQSDKIHLFGELAKQELLRLRLDRKVQYSKAFKMFCLNNLNSKCWQEYLDLIYSLLDTCSTIGVARKLKLMLQIEVSYGQMMLSQISSSKETIKETIAILQKMNLDEDNQQMNNISIQVTPKNIHYLQQNLVNSIQLQQKLQRNVKSTLQKSVPFQLQGDNEHQGILSKQLTQNQTIKLLGNSKIISILKEKSQRIQKQIALKKAKLHTKKSPIIPSVKLANQYNSMSNSRLIPFSSLEQLSNSNLQLVGSPHNLSHLENDQLQEQNKSKINSSRHSFLQFQTNENFLNHLKNQVRKDQNATQDEHMHQSLGIDSSPKHKVFQQDQQTQQSQLRTDQQTSMYATAVHESSQQKSDKFLNKLGNKPELVSVSNGNKNKIQIPSSLSNLEEIKSQPYINQEHLNQHERVSAFHQLPVSERDHLQNQIHNQTVNNISLDNIDEAPFHRDEYEYNIPSDVLCGYASLQEAEVLIKEKSYYEACDILTKIHEDFKYFFPRNRFQAVDLLSTCFDSLNIVSEELQSFKRNLNCNLFYDIQIFIDVYEKELIEHVQGIQALIFEQVTYEKYDRVGLSIITDILDEILAPTTQYLLNSAQKAWLQLQIKVLIEEYRQKFYQRPTLFNSVMSYLSQLSKRSQISKYSIQSDNIDTLLYKKFILCISSIDLWDDLQIHLILVDILKLFDIELLVLDVKESVRKGGVLVEGGGEGADSEQKIFNLFENTNQSIIKLFKNVNHLYSYLSNMRLCTESYGIPLIVEKFQSGFFYLRENFSIFLQNNRPFIYFALFGFKSCLVDVTQLISIIQIIQIERQH